MRVLVCAAGLGLAAVARTAAGAQTVPVADARYGDGRVSLFYTYTDPVPATRGTVLRTEPVPETLTLPKAGQARRMLYSSRGGADGTTPIAVSGEIFEPQGSPPPGGWPIVAWAHGTTGISDICAPSWQARSYRDIAYLDAWLAQGYAVVASDYEGLGTPGMHPYLNVRSEAHGVLDAVRAALADDRRLRNEIAIVGQSQGAGAAFGSAAFAPTYAPELDVRGTVATGVPYFSPSVPSARPADPAAVDPGIAYVMYIVLGLQTSQKPLVASDYFGPEALPVFELARVECVDALEGDVSLARLTDAGALEPAVRTLIAKHLAEFEYPTLKLRAPVFVGTGLADRDVPPPVQQRLVKDACAAGTTVVAHEYRGLTHGETVNASLADSEPFVRAVFAGKKVVPVCSPAPQ